MMDAEKTFDDYKDYQFDCEGRVSPTPRAN